MACGYRWAELAHAGINEADFICKPEFALTIEKVGAKLL